MRLFRTQSFCALNLTNGEAELKQISSRALIRFIISRQAVHDNNARRFPQDLFASEQAAEGDTPQPAWQRLTSRKADKTQACSSFAVLSIPAIRAVLSTSDVCWHHIGLEGRCKHRDCHAEDLCRQTAMCCFGMHEDAALRQCSVCQVRPLHQCASRACTSEAYFLRWAAACSVCTLGCSQQPRLELSCDSTLYSDRGS